MFDLPGSASCVAVLGSAVTGADGWGDMVSPDGALRAGKGEDYAYVLAASKIAEEALQPMAGCCRHPFALALA